MEELEHRVWQRVLGPAEDMPLELKALMLESQALASGFGMLAKRAGEDKKPLLKKLHREELGILHTLKGISRLLGQPVSLQPLPAPREPEGRLLEKSYRKCLRLRQEYLARSAAGEFGEVFRLLGDRAEEQGIRICQVLGMM